MNWPTNVEMAYAKESAEQAKKKHDKNNEGKEKKLIKVCDKPLTYKEVFC